MDYLSMDVNILLSIVNMKLRDKYEDLDDLCFDFDIGREELEEKLAKEGFVYDEKSKSFR